MKIKITKLALLLLGFGAILSSCHKNQLVKGSSPKTGARYNDPNNGGYQVFKSTHPAPGPGLVPIEGGTFVLGGSADQDVTYEYNNVRRRVTVGSFYMDETEVANVDWREYLHWLEINFPGDRELYYNALPDTLVWRRPLSYNEPFVYNYLRNPAFNDYPVVGVSWDQAQDYCIWRTDRMNENILRSGGQLANWKEVGAGNRNGANGGAQLAPNNTTGGGAGNGVVTAGTGGGSNTPFNTDLYYNNQYKGAGIDGKKMIKDAGGKTTRTVRMEDGILKQGYRLPTETEWEYAALGLIGNTEFENITDGKMYPWNGMGVRSPKKRTRGLILANFKRGEGDNMGVGGYLNDKADITAPVKSYVPNDFGLYNMAGNVNEWTGDTYRQTSFEEVEDFNPFRGNQFKDKRYADPSKGLLAKDKYGRPIYDPAKSGKKQKWSELVAQQNGGAAAANSSTLPNGTAGNPVGAAGASPQANKSDLATKPYNPDFRGFADTVSSVLYGTTTLANDHSKVFKGGSWNDRAYWLNPATRRFMDEDDASAEVGFRCAMPMVGSTQIHPNSGPKFKIRKTR